MAQLGAPKLISLYALRRQEMVYTNETKSALKIAFEAHKDQCDKGGIPYIYHPAHLAEQMEDSLSCCVALLHDVVEDTPLSLDDLRAKGVSEEAVAAVALLTHEEGVDYMDYVRKIKESGNQAAIKVKLADLRHNSDISRRDDPIESLAKSIEKYKAAMELLLS
jgi:(p)ppGpp synthase/HD superfamily hydrolase